MVPANACVSHPGANPRDARDEGPNDAEREQLIHLIYHYYPYNQPYIAKCSSQIIAWKIATSPQHIHRKTDVSCYSHHQRKRFVALTHTHPVLEVELTDLFQNTRFLVQEGEKLCLLPKLRHSFVQNLLNRWRNEGVGVTGDAVAQSKPLSEYSVLPDMVEVDLDDFFEP